MTSIDPLLVELDGERRAIAADAVCEVVALGALTPVPLAPPSLYGLTQVHGRVLPVIAPGLRREPPRPGTPLVVVEVGSEQAAAIAVDLVIGRAPDGDARPLDVARLLADLRHRVEGR
jgi:purine-binding chemotaxis protein CheW